jgi:HEPN domain-containing protein
MRREIGLWLDQARRDLETAAYNAAGERWEAAAFYTQQSVEKALKALHLRVKRAPAGPTHSLPALARRLGAPRRFGRFLKELTAEYFVARYPDASGELPHLLYDEEVIQDYLGRAREVLAWVESKIGR